MPQPNSEFTVSMISIAFVLLAISVVGWQLRQSSVTSLNSNGIEITDAYAIAPAAGRAFTGYFKILAQNADALIAVSSEEAKSAAIHTPAYEGGRVRMAKLDQVALEPGAVTAFEPGGIHVMFFGVSPAVETGTSVAATLTFEKAGNIRLQLPVRPASGVAHAH